MANKLEQNVSKAKNDFNQAAKKQQEQVSSTEQNNSVASQVQINQLEKERPKKEFKQDLTPSGSKTIEVNAAVNANKNAEIDRKQDAFRARMQAQKGKAKEAFNRAASKEKEKTR